MTLPAAGACPAPRATRSLSFRLSAHTARGTCDRTGESSGTGGAPEPSRVKHDRAAHKRAAFVPGLLGGSARSAGRGTATAKGLRAWDDPQGETPLAGTRTSGGTAAGRLRDDLSGEDP